jgi:hypothetical protein
MMLIKQLCMSVNEIITLRIQMNCLRCSQPMLCGSGAKAGSPLIVAADHHLRTRPPISEYYRHPAPRQVIIDLRTGTRDELVHVFTLCTTSDRCKWSDCGKRSGTPPRCAEVSEVKTAIEENIKWAV